MNGTESAVARAVEKSSVGADEVFIATTVHSTDPACEDVLNAAEASRERLDLL